MILTVNGVRKDISSPALSVLELLSLEEVASPDMVSVQVNGDILKKEAFGSMALKNEDEVEFLYFMGGGACPWR